MEKYPELANSPGTSNYDEVAARLLERWSNGGVLDEAERQILTDAFPELSEETNFFGEDFNAA